jgi:hypothetical protein
LTLRFVEDACDATIAYLKANFAAKIAAINTEYTDTMVAPDTAAGYLIYEPLAVEAFPYVHVLGTFGALHPAGNSPGEMTVAHNLTVQLTHRDGSISRDLLTRRLARYARAITQILKEGSGQIGVAFAPANKGYTVNLGNPLYELKDVMRTEDAPTIQRVIVHVELHRQEVLA